MNFNLQKQKNEIQGYLLSGDAEVHILRSIYPCISVQNVQEPSGSSKACTFIEHRLSYAVVTVYSAIVVILLSG